MSVAVDCEIGILRETKFRIVKPFENTYQNIKRAFYITPVRLSFVLEHALYFFFAISQSEIVFNVLTSSDISNSLLKLCGVKNTEKKCINFRRSGTLSH